MPLTTLLAPLATCGPPLAPGSITMRINPALPPLRANQKQIVKVFTLLISNLLAVAEKHTPICIGADDIRSESGVKFVRIVLSDTTPDWTPEQRIRFFAPFSRVAGEDSQRGLDLAVCFFVVHHHGGQIHIAGRSDCRVAVDLPLDPVEPEARSVEQTQLDQLFQRERSWEEFLTPSE